MTRQQRGMRLFRDKGQYIRIIDDSTAIVPSQFIPGKEYQENMANNAERSPILKSKFTKILKSNFVMINKTPVNDNAIPKS